MRLGDRRPDRAGAVAARRRCFRADPLRPGTSTNCWRRGTASARTGHGRAWRAAAAGVREAEALEVAEGAPLMLVERVAYAQTGQRVEFARDLSRGDVAWSCGPGAGGHLARGAPAAAGAALRHGHLEPQPAIRSLCPSLAGGGLGDVGVQRVPVVGGLRASRPCAWSCPACRSRRSRPPPRSPTLTGGQWLGNGLPVSETDLLVARGREALQGEALGVGPHGHVANLHGPHGARSRRCRRRCRPATAWQGRQGRGTTRASTDTPVTSKPAHGTSAPTGADPGHRLVPPHRARRGVERACPAPPPRAFSITPATMPAVVRVSLSRTGPPPATGGYRQRRGRRSTRPPRQRLP